MDVQKIMQALNVNPQMRDKAMQAWQTANEMGQGVHTKQEALKLLAEKGIDRNALQKVGSYINHPLAGVAAKMAGVNLERIREDFNSLLNDTQTTITPVKPNNNDPLAKYKNSLHQL